MRHEYWRLHTVLRCALRRHPLVRRHDRIEAWSLLVGLAVMLTMAAVAGAVGTAVHDTRSAAYAAQAQTRHPVTATAVTDAPAWPPRPQAGMVTVRWMDGPVEHTDVAWAGPGVESGDPVTVWLDSAGRQVSAPQHPSAAVRDAVAVGLSLWVAALVCVVLVLVLVRRRLDRHRLARWDADFARFAAGMDRDRRYDS